MTRRGRPRIPAKSRRVSVTTRFDRETLSALDRAAKTAGITRTAAVLHLVRVGLRKSLLNVGGE